MNKKRISFLASLTKGFNTLVDIGCDHGYTIKEALEKQAVKYAYALEVNEKPLEKAKQTLKEAELLEKVSFFLSDGLKSFNEFFDVAIISGMGGRLISSILEVSKDKFKGKCLILEPQSDNYLVRMWLMLNNFNITSEYTLEENNKYYEIIVANPGQSNYSWLDLNYGPILRLEKSNLFMKHYKKILNIKRNAYNNSKRQTTLPEEIIELEYILGERKMDKVLYDEANYYTKMYIDDEKRDLIIMFPGGGYNHTSPREAEPIALKFNAIGYNVVVFHYREKLDFYPEIYTKISKEIEALRKEKNIANVFLHGYSAGGHLALELALHQDLYKIGSIKGLILGYPVVSSKPGILHEGSFANLLGPNDSKELRTRLSEELEVNEKAPNLFLWTTATDNAVPAQNSLLLLEAYQKYNIKYECHIFPMGHHGLGLATKETARDENDIIPYVSTWFKMLENWLELQK